MYLPYQIEIRCENRYSETRSTYKSNNYLNNLSSNTGFIKASKLNTPPNFAYRSPKSRIFPEIIGKKRK